MNKRNLLTFFGLISAVSLGVLVYFQYLAPKVITETTKTLNASQDTQDVSENYVDDQNGFSFDYPKLFHVYHEDTIATDGDRFDSNAIEKNECSEGERCPVVLFGVQENPEGLSIERYISEVMQWKIDGKMEQKNLGNKIGKSFYPVSDFDGTSSPVTWIQLDEKHFLVFTSLNKTESMGVYREILSSLKFSK